MSFAKIFKALTDRRNYFCCQREYMFRQRLSKNSESPVLPETRETSLTVIKTPEEANALISAGFDLGNCPFLDNAKKWLGKGVILFLIFFGKTLAHSSQVSTGNYDALSETIFRNIRYENTGYIGPCYTSPPYRGRGLYPFALLKICEFLRENGKEQAVISTKKNNDSSVKGIQKASFEFTAEVLNIKLLLWRFCKIYEK